MCQLLLDELIVKMVEWQLVKPQDIVNGGVKLEEHSRRNANFKVFRVGLPGYFVKQVIDLPYSKHYIEVESAVYEVCKSHTGLIKVRDLVPEFVTCKVKDGVLITKLIEDVPAPWEVLRTISGGKFVDYEMNLGSVMGMLHAEFTAAALDENSSLKFVPRSRQPPVLWMFNPGPEILTDITSAAAQILETISANSTFERIKNTTWETNVLIHGDIKVDNFLIYKEKNEFVRIILTDWELAQFGDPAWDVGSMFADFLREWVFSLPLEQGLFTAHKAVKASLPLQQCQRSIRNFWRGYRQARKLSLYQAEKFLKRSVVWAAARLLQTTYEHAITTTLPTLADHCLLLLQLASNILANPSMAIENLYGISAITEEKICVTNPPTT